MRILLVAHGFPPLERTGVETYTASLAAELARAGHAASVFAPRARADLPHLSLRREERDGYTVHWVTLNVPPRSPAEAADPPGVAAAFGEVLAREQPDVVHFQHLVKLGFSLVHEARRRGIPCVYTAHDYYAVCHRYTLLRPDLERCDVIGDSMACARCDLGLSYLDRRGDLGDYQMGALASQLSPEERRALRALVEDGEPAAAGMSYADLDAAFDARQVLDGKRAEAFAAIDRILAPTRFLADRLRQGGVDPERISVLPYGIDTSHLRDVPPVNADRARALRIGFMSGLAKHKGAHVLLDAFEMLEEPAECLLFGGSTDERYVAEIRRRADELGAVFGGPYERRELAERLASVDVVVVPSTWYENQPIVILEAFAAGRPVVAPRLGAFPENVRDGVDGLLYEPDDPASLALVLERLARDRELLHRLAAGVPAVRDIATQASELVAIYRELRDASRAAEAGDPPVLPSLRAFVASYRGHARRPARELLERALAGLRALRAGLGDEAPAGSAEDLIRAALASGSKVEEDLADARRDVAWTHATSGAKDDETAWMRGVIADRDAAIASLTAERDWLKGIVEERDKELGALRGAFDRRLQELEAELAWRRAEMDAALGLRERPGAAGLLGMTGLGRRMDGWRASAWMRREKDA